MEERFVVLNSSGTILSLVKNKIRMSPQQQIDLVKFLGKTVAQIEMDQEISTNLAFNNLKLMEVVDSRKRDDEVSKKIDALMGMLQEAGPQKEREIIRETKEIVQVAGGDVASMEALLDEFLKRTGLDKEQKKIKKEKDEEEMREKALQKLVEKGSKMKGKLVGFVKGRDVEEDEDFSDLIDF